MKQEKECEIRLQPLMQLEVLNLKIFYPSGKEHQPQNMREVKEEKTTFMHNFTLKLSMLILNAFLCFVLASSFLVWFYMSAAVMVNNVRIC